MDLRRWIAAEHTDLAERFASSISACIPQDRWREQAGGGGSSVAFLRFHTTWHEDLAVGGLVLGEEPLLRDRRRDLGIDRLPEVAGLGETEDGTLTGALDLDALESWVADVRSRTASWLAAADLEALDDVPDAPARLEALGVPQAEVPWLHRMWTGKPVGWFVRWEAIGHVQNHLGEMISVRGRLGLSPF